MALTALRELLARRGLSVVELTRRSEALFGETPHAHIPHNWYHLIEVHGLSPHIGQLVALSKIANAPLLECLRAVGVDLRRLWSLQARIKFEHTSLIPDAFYAAHLAPTCASPPCPCIGLPNTTRLSDLLGPRFEFTPTTASASLRRYRYARIGQTDLGSVPALLPGSLVRVDTANCETTACGDVAAVSTPLYLIDDGNRLTCRHIVRVGLRRALLVSPNPEYVPTECRLPGDVRILGAVDLELRQIESPSRTPRDPVADGRNPAPPACSPNNGGSLGAALRAARDRLGLHLRDVQQLTQIVAADCGSDRYAIGLGSLSDYEGRDVLPRHIEKVFTLACVYATDFFDLLTLGGVPYDREAVTRAGSESRAESRAMTSVDPDDCDGIGTIPEYLVPHLALKGVMPRDIYVVGRSMTVLHPALQGAIALVARRHNGSITDPVRRTYRDRPLYLLQQRDGDFLCGWCIRDEKSITIVPHPEVPARPYRLLANDVDVIGRVTAVLRRL